MTKEKSQEKSQKMMDRKINIINGGGSEKEKINKEIKRRIQTSLEYE